MKIFDLPPSPEWFQIRIIKGRRGTPYEAGKVLPANHGMVYWDGENLLAQDANGKQWMVKLVPVDQVEEIESETKEKKKRK